MDQERRLWPIMAIHKVLAFIWLTLSGRKRAVRIRREQVNCLKVALQKWPCERSQVLYEGRNVYPLVSLLLRSQFTRNSDEIKLLLNAHVTLGKRNHKKSCNYECFMCRQWIKRKGLLLVMNPLRKYHPSSLFQFNGWQLLAHICGHSRWAARYMTEHS